jgi:hypothetical protein
MTARSKVRSALPAAHRHVAGDRTRRPSLPSVTEFSELVRLVYAGALDSSAWHAFLRSLTGRLHGNAAILMLRVPRHGEIPLNVTHGAVPNRETEYFRHFMAVDPFVQLPEGRAVTMHEFRRRRRARAQRVFPRVARAAGHGLRGWRGPP